MNKYKFSDINLAMKESMSARYQSVGLISVLDEIENTAQVCSISSFDCLSISDEHLPFCSFRLSENSVTLQKYIERGRASFHYLTSSQQELAIEFAKSKRIHVSDYNFPIIDNEVSVPDSSYGFRMNLYRTFAIPKAVIVVSTVSGISTGTNKLNLLQYRNRKYLGNPSDRDALN